MLGKIKIHSQLKVIKSFSKSVYSQQMYQRWIQNAQSVDPIWHSYFSKTANQINPKVNTSNLFGIYQLIKSYQTRGNEVANLDPLNLEKIQQLNLSTAPLALQIEQYGFKESDLDKPIQIQDVNIPLHDIAEFLQKKPVWTLREIIKELKEIYCKNIGYQFQHIPFPVEKKWLREYIETPLVFQLNSQNKQKIYERLLRNETFTNFVKNKWTTSKRFGLEGCDTLINALGHFSDCAAKDKVQDLIFAMPHRGRLNVLTQTFHKPYEKIFCEFNDNKIQTESEKSIQGFSGDVKYHLGTTHDKFYEDLNHTLRMTILPNPSHLETVDPVLYGKTRAIIDIEKDFNKEKTIGILMHGDAAFAGQGVVYETLQMQDLESFCVGGVIHIIINNQIGFTTTPQQSRSSQYCTDVAKTVGAPIIHVNADDPESVVAATQLAYDYRKKFKKDIIIDIIGYRRFGHNELDQPSFTQPLMYNIINKMKPVCQKYEEKLLEEGIITQTYIQEKTTKYNDKLNQSFEKSKNMNKVENEWNVKKWQEIKAVQINSNTPKGQGVNIGYLQTMFNKIMKYPDNFSINPQVKKIFEARQKSMQDGVGIDFATAESLAFATLIDEGYNVRLSGQDVQRGTFSHRHSIIHDQEHSNRFQMIAENLLPEDQRDRIWIHNSHLSEYGVLGFEYGYSITNPNVLTMWEAQFGDFANGCQVIIDNYLTSGESKWATNSGYNLFSSRLVLLLPHGMDGQGPEHSSARMERFLQLCEDDPALVLKKEEIIKQINDSNIQIVQCSTSANYFLALRRQMRRSFRKPLIMFNSKKLLRMRNACSQINEFKEGVIFNRVYGEQQKLVSADKIEKVIICSGQFYYDLLEKREQLQLKNVAIVRIEQIAPFPFTNVIENIKDYKNAKFIWAQEEHRNYGPWSYVEDRIKNCLIYLKQKNLIDNPELHFQGRRYSASPAAGSNTVHQLELKNLLTQIYN